MWKWQAAQKSSRGRCRFGKWRGNYVKEEIEMRVKVESSKFRIVPSHGIVKNRRRELWKRFEWFKFLLLIIIANSHLNNAFLVADSKAITDFKFSFNANKRQITNNFTNGLIVCILKQFDLSIVLLPVLHSYSYSYLFTWTTPWRSNNLL